LNLKYDQVVKGDEYTLIKLIIFYRLLFT